MPGSGSNRFDNHINRQAFENTGTNQGEAEMERAVVTGMKLRGKSQNIIDRFLKRFLDIH